MANYNTATEVVEPPSSPTVSPTISADACVSPGKPDNTDGVLLDDASLNFGMMLHHVREGLIRRIEARLAESRVDLNFSQFRVLKVLNEGNATTSTEVARWMNHDAGALTRLLDRLCQLGYLQRQARAGDRRQVDLVLTPAGKELATRTAELAAQAVAHALDPLSSDERRQLMSLLGRVRETL